jgi:hypothetical protein
MARKDYGTYVILMLFRRDLQPEARQVALEKIEWEDLRWTRKDVEYADRVDLIDLDGTCRTMKLRPYHGHPITTVTRPDSFEKFEIDMPWAVGPYLPVKVHPVRHPRHY